MSRQTELSNIADALFTKTQQGVLAILFGNSESSFYLNEIARKAGVGKGSIQRELNKLVSCGLVHIEKQGNQNHYSANQQAPIFNELKSIVVKTFGLAGILSSSIEPIKDGLDFTFVYGSMAKGEEHTGSDIDVLLVGKDLGYSEVMALFADAEEQLSRTINPTILTLVEFNQRLEKKQNFMMKVLEQPKIWLMGKESFDRIVNSES
jgi:predicted nucleotidyltransferase